MNEDVNLIFNLKLGLCPYTIVSFHYPWKTNQQPICWSTEKKTSLPNTLWVGVWFHKYLLRLLEGPNISSPGMTEEFWKTSWRIIPFSTWLIPMPHAFVFVP